MLRADVPGEVPLPREPLATAYDPATVEPPAIARALEHHAYHAEVDASAAPFVISMPPPNITGAAHLGHASTYTAMDVLTRYHRLLGENAVWLPGQDHAAIATEAVLVRELAKEGLSRNGLGREAFLDRAWAWREQYGNRINDQFKRLGFGPDWDRERFTMDEGLSAAVVHAFVELYRQGLIYRGTRMVNWDPKAQSTLSDAEVENATHDGSLWHIRYRAEDGGEGVVIATTRPETFFADVAIAVHPDDERYRGLVGTRVVLPIVGRAIPIITDASIERDFGTGALKVTPAHDVTDYEIAARFNASADAHARLPLATVIDFMGLVCAPVWRDPNAAPADAERAAWDAQAERMAPFIGTDRFAARTAVAAELARVGALERVEPHSGTIPVSSRSGEVVEPLLSLQWFCSMQPLAGPALEAYRSGALRFVPERFGRTYEHGLENIRDWNISRQVWWGHQLPVWYTPDDEPIVAASEEAALTIARERFGTTELRRDPDTLDTWFSSGLWPFSILGWPERTPELAAWYPNTVMITGREIIFLWVSRMVMLGLHFLDALPFTTVFITPLVFDLQGRKMSKSLGNAIDPMDLVEKYGADALRFGTLRQMRLESQELRFDEEKCDEARRFANKLWNALRFIASLDEGLPDAIELPNTAELTTADRWILSKTATMLDTVGSAYDGFAMGVATDALIAFGWFTFCDWYLEAAKADAQRATRSRVLTFVLDALARALWPVAPFVAGALVAELRPGADIAELGWPHAADVPVDREAEADFDRFIARVGELRNARAEFGLAPRAPMTVVGPSFEPAVAEQLRILAGATLRVDPDATQLSFADRLGALRIEADPALLRERYERDLVRLSAEIERSEKKLANDKFVQNGKPEVVAAEREKLTRYAAERAAAEESLAALPGR